MLPDISSLEDCKKSTVSTKKRLSRTSALSFSANQCTGNNVVAFNEIKKQRKLELAKKTIYSAADNLSW